MIFRQINCLPLYCYRYKNIHQIIYRNKNAKLQKIKLEIGVPIFESGWRNTSTIILRARGSAFESRFRLKCFSLNINYAPYEHCIVLKGWSLLPNALRPFQDLLCSPEFRYYLDVNMSIKFCSEGYFLRFEVL